MRSHGIVRLSIALVVCLLLGSALRPGPLAAGPSPTDVPEVLAAEVNEIHALALKDGTLFWGAACCGELCLPPPHVRSKPAGGGPVHTLTEGDCAIAMQLSSGLAVDEAYVYWIDTQNRLVKQRRSATPGEVPTTVTTLAAGSGYTVAVDGSYIYWLENQLSAPFGGYITRLPKAGGNPELVAAFSGNAAWGLKVDAASRVYYLHTSSPASTLHRATPTPWGWFDDLVIGTAGQVMAYTFDGTNLYWIERASSGPDLLVRSAPLDNPSLFITLQTVAGTGNPWVWEMAVDADNLYWVESYPHPDDSDDIFRMPFAGGPPAIVAGYPSGSDERPGDLVSSGRFLFWRYGNQILRLPTTASLPDLTVQDLGLEVVQSIQGPTNDVPLTEGKETFVRLYARLVPDSPNLTEVVVSPSAWLVGSRNGIDLPGSPLLPVKPSASIKAQFPDRRDFQNSVLFKLPPDWTDGTVTLQGILNPMHTTPENGRFNNTASAVVTFQNVPSYCLYMVPVETTSGTLKGPGSVSAAFFDRAVSLWPLTHFEVGWDGGPPQRRPKIPLGIGGSDPYNLNSDFEMGYLLTNLWFTFWLNKGYPCNGVGTAVAAAVPAASRWGMSGLPGLDVLFFLAGGDPNGTGANDPVGGIRGLAHELGHVLGRGHVNCPSWEGEWPGWPLDGNYPYPPCQIDNEGPAAHVGLDAMTRQLLVAEVAADYMSYYSGALWTSDYTYRALIQRLTSASRLAEEVSPVAGDKLLIGGMLGPAPLIGYAYKVDAAQAAEIAAKLETSTLPSLDYQLQTFNAAGSLIAATPLRVMQLQTESSTDMPLFVHLVDDTPAPARFEVRQVGGPVVLTRTAGANPPSLAITAPASGAVVGTQLDIAWSASDADGDPLLFTVRYSPDNGATWRVLGNQTSERSLSVATEGLHGGSQALVEVIASDGVHSTSAIAGPFTMPRHAPQVIILDNAYQQISPSFPAAVLQSDVTDLHAQAYDAEDGMLTGTALQWQVTGAVSRGATGDKLPVEDLPPGSYEVTLTATDSDGASTQASAALTVSPKRIYDGSTAPLLDGYCDDPAYADDQDSVSLRYDDGSVAEARLVRVGDDLYACLAGLPLGAWTSSFAALQFDLNNSGDPVAMPDDLSFLVTEDGVASTTVGDGQGGFIADSVPQGLAAAVSHSDTSWNAEFRIDTIRLGGWNKLARMRVGHYWREFVGDDWAWPVRDGWNSPASWGLTALGELTQTIVFEALPDRRVGDPPFALSATTSSGLPPEYTAQGACTVSANMVTLAGPGTCTITASQPGNASYAPAPSVTQSFAVKTLVFLPLITKQQEPPG